MNADQAFSSLIGRVYDCAVDASLWSDVLGELAGPSGASSADLSVWNLAERKIETAATWNISKRQRELYAANVHLNPALPIGYVQPLCEPYCLSREVGLDVVKASRIWKLAVAEFELLDGVTTPLTRKIVQGSAWSSQRHIDRGPFTDEEIDFIRLVAPHVRRAVEISGLLQYGRGLQATIREVLEAVSAASFVVTPDGVLRFHNSAAEAVLGEGTVLRLRGDELVANNPAVRDLIASVVSGRGQTARDLLIQDGAGRELQVTCARLDRIEQGLDAPLLVIVRRPEADLTTPISKAASLFGLTNGETMVLGQIMEGRSLDDAADVIGVSRSTVKTHLDAIYAKSGVRKQTDLMRKVVGLMTPMG